MYSNRTSLFSVASRTARPCGSILSRGGTAQTFSIYTLAIPFGSNRLEAINIGQPLRLLAQWQDSQPFATDSLNWVNVPPPFFRRTCLSSFIIIIFFVSPFVRISYVFFRSLSLLHYPPSSLSFFNFIFLLFFLIIPFVLPFSFALHLFSPIHPFPRNSPSKSINTYLFDTHRINYQWH